MGNNKGNNKINICLKKCVRYAYRDERITKLTVATLNSMINEFSSFVLFRCFTTTRNLKERNMRSEICENYANQVDKTLF